MSLSSMAPWNLKARLSLRVALATQYVAYAKESFSTLPNKSLQKHLDTTLREDQGHW